MANNKKDEKAVEAVRKYYNCNGKYLCPNFHDCRFGDGENTSYDCNECGADEFYAGYMQGLFDKEHHCESTIKWKTDKPKDNDMYLATFVKTSEGDASVVPLYRIGGNWETTSWDSIKQERVIAWCKLSDIEPYKEKEE